MVFTLPLLASERTGEQRKLTFQSSLNHYLVIVKSWGNKPICGEDCHQAHIHTHTKGKVIKLQNSSRTAPTSLKSGWMAS